MAVEANPAHHRDHLPSGWWQRFYHLAQVMHMTELAEPTELQGSHPVTVREIPITSVDEYPQRYRPLGPDPIAPRLAPALDQSSLWQATMAALKATRSDWCPELFLVVGRERTRVPHRPDFVVIHLDGSGGRGEIGEDGPASTSPNQVVMRLFLLDPKQSRRAFAWIREKDTSLTYSHLTSRDLRQDPHDIPESQWRKLEDQALPQLATAAALSAMELLPDHGRRFAGEVCALLASPENRKHHAAVLYRLVRFTTDLPAEYVWQPLYSDDETLREIPKAFSSIQVTGRFIAPPHGVIDAVLGHVGDASAHLKTRRMACEVMRRLIPDIEEPAIIGLHKVVNSLHGGEAEGFYGRKPWTSEIGPGHIGPIDETLNDPSMRKCPPAVREFLLAVRTKLKTRLDELDSELIRALQAE